MFPPLKFRQLPGRGYLLKGNNLLNTMNYFPWFIVSRACQTKHYNLTNSIAGRGLEDKSGIEPETKARNTRVIEVGESFDQVNPYDRKYIIDSHTRLKIGLPV